MLFILSTIINALQPFLQIMPRYYIIRTYTLGLNLGTIKGLITYIALKVRINQIIRRFLNLCTVSVQ